MHGSSTSIKLACYHCGEDCGKHPVQAHDKQFCCQGCLSVYEILDKSGMCTYYKIGTTPGSSQQTRIRAGKFTFLDQEKIANTLISFRDDGQTHVTFYLPQIHCSSCLWLLENLHKLDQHIQTSRANFERKEVYIVFNHAGISLRRVAELLTSVGYEPYISLQHLSQKKVVFNRSKIFKLGVAGFCFANIMLFSFPEYLGIDAQEQSLVLLFRYLNLALSLPVLFYSASEFYLSAWKSLRHGFLNIDAPIVLATLVTFGRSVYEIYTGTGSGYFDSMSGIVFFMLLGRVLQDKTYEQLDFERDYTSFFPVAVSRIVEQREEIVTLPEIKLDDTLLLHNQELIPADGILTKGRAVIDYSFVTGESISVTKEMGEIVYAGGKQLEGNIEILVIKEVNQGYLTRLWNNSERATEKNKERSFVNLLSRYFTLLLFVIAAFSAWYWYAHDASRVLNVVTSILIVACPCALLLSNTFTNGNILRILGKKGLYLRNAQAIEDIGSIDHIVFDKTGTLTRNYDVDIRYNGKPLIPAVKYRVASLAKQSTHPISRSIAAWLGEERTVPVLAFKETPGMGIEGIVGKDLISLGSARFVTGNEKNNETLTTVYLSIEDRVWGVFHIRNRYRENIPALLHQLQQKYSLSILSGDNPGELPYLAELLGNNTDILFNQSPQDKLDHIRQLQLQGKKVMMVGDGLNDAGALKQADAGIAVSDSNNNFTPASDGIIQATQLNSLQRFILLCRANRNIVVTAFVVSILYNLVGLYFAVQGMLSPMIAAILMPVSSLSILLITFGLSNLSAATLKLK
jgi:Cu+-exporting ATPase